MNPKLIKFLKIILPLTLGVFLIWYSISSLSPEEREQTLRYVSQADPKWVILSIVLGIISHLSRAYRWKFLLEPLGYNPKVYNSFMAVMAGYLANLGIPRSGEILRGGLISTYEDIPFKKAFGTIISERVVDLVMLMLIIGITLMFQSNNLISFLGEKLTNPFITFGLLVILIIIGIVALRVLKNSKNTFIVKIRNFGIGILEGVKSIYKIKKRKAFIFHTFLIWTLYVLMFYVIKFTVPETASLTIGPILVTFVAGSLAMSTTNGGIGAFPLAIAAVLLLFNIDNSAGIAFGWILWGSQTAINSVVGSLSFLFLPILNRGK
ncbi:lysylphosphatidylglycerol synthase transmembrane domain-containing protein [Aquimarina sp. 2201CG5-10]|uniref:lysylphosphatidylglycerol synthase transmembrane domain-containing protein n=1 Tax=Aquimarina callyspongiae TaxID=3098150 RepID=UPI002AB4ACC2|nr:lysylphosphatidylglycerol synthase transmembrane domain-containing protein [Aquimarina sp. 2201CG5-10]MDY8135261.1 lysylphosphatidylglycerol synthase transmembrane domain-containing protein [Aquimarina sp. 2201CG5-10]